jgi:2-dehydropantoate 2-reductase
MSNGSWPQVAVVGAGAVGCYYGGMLARAGCPVTLIGRPAHVEAIERDGLLLDTLSFKEHVKLRASTGIDAARGAQLVLFCVKSTDTGATAQQLAPMLAPDAIVLSMQNGVDNLERLRVHIEGPAFAAVVYVAAAMAGAGHVRHTGRGDLVIGAIERDAAARNAALPLLQQVSGWFERAAVGCPVSDNVEGELWAKLLINCAYNAISALGRARYRRIGAHPLALGVMKDAVAEVIAVARAAGVTLPEGDLVEAAVAISRSLAGATSSTAQDIARGKRTEIDYLNGYVVRRGDELGVPVPVNRTLHALVKLLEEAEPGEAR